MANQKCAAGSDATCDALQAIVNKALGYPKIGVHVGGGLHVVMPPTWDGQGAVPAGWTKSAVPVWMKDALTSWVPIPDTQATVLQGAPAQALLSAGEQTTLAAAIAARVTIDPEAQGAGPKVSAVAAAQVAAAEQEVKL